MKIIQNEELITEDKDIQKIFKELLNGDRCRGMTEDLDLRLSVRGQKYSPVNMN